MRKVILFIANSLDGYIAGPHDEVDWLFTDDDYGMTDFFKNVDVALIGRRTYDVMLSLGESAYKGKKNYVFSRRGITEQDKNVEIISDKFKEFVQSLKQSEGKNIWLVGGGVLIESFFKFKLIDEIILTIHPILLGSGIPLFRRQEYQQELNLIGCKSYPSGIVQLHYKIN